MSWPATVWEKDAKEAERLRDDAVKRGDSKAAEHLQDRKDRSERAAKIARGER